MRVSVVHASPRQNQAPYQGFVAVARRQVQGRRQHGILDAGVDVHADGEEEEGALDVPFLDRDVEEVLALGVELRSWIILRYYYYYYFTFF